jgi:hypothetical protein
MIEVSQNVEIDSLEIPIYNEAGEQVGSYVENLIGEQKRNHLTLTIKDSQGVQVNGIIEIECSRADVDTEEKLASFLEKIEQNYLNNH